MIKAILTDIEGTTTSLSFVKETLFPYARARLPEFISQHGHELPIRKILDETAIIAGIDKNETAGLCAQLIEWIDTDQKITPLKTLQGHIWEEGYRQQHYFGHIYDDAAACLKAWHTAGISLYVYSSGSVHAQALLFAHTRFGDLRPFFSGYFDTTTGQKQAVSSYQIIATAIQHPPEHILFLSDIQEELDAAASAGFKVCLLDRLSHTGLCNTPNSASDFYAIHL